MVTNHFSTLLISNNPISQNFYLHSHYLPSLQRRMKVVQTDNLIYTDAGTSCDSFNILYVINGFEITFQELAQAIRHYNQKAFDFCLWVDQENLTDNLGRLLRKLKIYEAGDEPGMMLSLNKYSVNHLNSDIRQVSNPEMVNTFATILASAWRPPDQEVIKYYNSIGSSMIENPNDVRFYIYYQNEKPVSVFEIFPTDNQTAGIYNLVTLSAYRGAGIGSKMMTYGLNFLKENGYSRAILQASENGLSIYKRLGFEEVSRYFEFQKK